MAFDYHHEQYRRARAEAFRWSGGLCQFCGVHPASESHHWALQYKTASETTPDDLTALCGPCHAVATELRRLHRYGGSVWSFYSKLREVLEQCDIKSPSAGYHPSSTTTERLDSIPEARRSWKSRRSRARKAAIAPSPTTSGSSNSSARTRSGSTRAERLRSRSGHSGPVSRTEPASSSRERRSARVSSLPTATSSTTGNDTVVKGGDIVGHWGGGKVDHRDGGSWLGRES